MKNNIILYIILVLFSSSLKAELRIDITKGNLDPIPVAILEFNSNKVEELNISKKINNVIKSNLERSGLFSILPEKTFLNNKISFNKKDSAGSKAAK